MGALIIIALNLRFQSPQKCQHPRSSRAELEPVVKDSIRIAARIWSLHVHASIL
jgi:hypothetical protein